MNTKEMLELAAEAAGIKVPTKKDYPWAWIDERGIHRDISCGGDGTRMSHWNPITDDGDALRLAVKLDIVPRLINSVAFAWKDGICDTQELVASDPYAATRLAIVRAAAEIGRNMK